MVIKKDQNREQYDRNKIMAGILRACHKRPVPVQKINELVDQVENEIFNRGEKEIESSVIGEIVMKYLIGLDAVAYVRFASVYREFKDVNTFMDELKKLLRQKDHEGDHESPGSGDPDRGGHGQPVRAAGS